MQTEGPFLRAVSPFLIVRSLRDSVAFYHEALGFELLFEVPEDDPYFAMVSRDQVSLCLKQINDATPPMPNHVRHEWARWDAFINTQNPDALYDEFCGKGVTIHQPLAHTDDGLRAFEIQDVDGYVLCFGCESKKVQES